MTLSELDTDNAELIKNYERALYRAFSDTDIRSIPYIADYDHRSRRLRSHIPYSDQRIFAARVRETVLAAVALNTNLNAPLQLETFGFTIDKIYILPVIGSMSISGVLPLEIVIGSDHCWPVTGTVIINNNSIKNMLVEICFFIIHPII